MKTILTALVLCLGFNAFADHHEEKKGMAHDKEHQHVKAEQKDHEHDENHHKPHDHKAHHPDHADGVKAKGDKKK